MHSSLCGLGARRRGRHKGTMPRLRKRSILLAGHATSLALEPEFWAVLDEMAASEGVSVAGLIAKIDGTRADRPLASACRVAALAFARR
jgi:predicted DNA-binding ribbon-helix-helix protein